MGGSGGGARVLRDVQGRSLLACTHTSVHQGWSRTKGGQARRVDARRRQEGRSEARRSPPSRWLAQAAQSLPRRGLQARRGGHRGRQFMPG